jgi:hypothetical protein
MDEPFEGNRTAIDGVWTFELFAGESRAVTLAQKKSRSGFPLRLLRELLIAA